VRHIIIIFKNGNWKFLLLLLNYSILIWYQNIHSYRTTNGPGIFYVKARGLKFWHLRGGTDTLRLVVVPQMFLVYSPASVKHHMMDQCFISFSYQRFNLNSQKYMIIT